MLAVHSYSDADIVPTSQTYKNLKAVWNIFATNFIRIQDVQQRMVTLSRFVRATVILLKMLSQSDYSI